MSSNARRTAFAFLLLCMPVLAMAQISINFSVNVAPPELPVYVQPPLPAEGYIWTPGYWAWDDDGQDYYWVPGTWVEAPQPGYLWTPGYWGSDGSAFGWHEGYWGSEIGFYGGVNYGFGYVGTGYAGGYWQGGHLFYNTAVVNVGTTHITNVYNKTVINNVTINRVSYNGGSGGIQAKPTPAEEAVERAPHLAPVAAQREQVTTARSNPALRASANHGNPPIAATPKPGVFKGAGVVAAKPVAAAHETPSRGEPARTAPVHAATPARAQTAEHPAARPAAPAHPTATRPAPARAVSPRPATAAPRPQAPAARPAEPARTEAAPARPAPAPEERRAAEPAPAARPAAPKRPEQHPQEHDHDRS